MARHVRSTLLTGFPTGFLVGLLGALIMQQPLRLALLEAAGCGVVLGLLFTITRARAARPRQPRGAVTPALLPGERVLKEGPASRTQRSSGVGGLLFLTDRRVIFRPYAPGTRAEDLSLPLDQLARAQAVMIAWMHATGLHLQTKAGEVERFIVPERDREAWAEAITAALPAPADPSDL